MKVEILAEAEGDLIDGFAFYQRQGAGLGHYFLDALFADIDSLQLFAGLHEQHFGYHRLLSKRFPYAIYYRIKRDVARVYAVLDCRRSPSRSTRRLQQQSTD